MIAWTPNLILAGSTCAGTSWSLALYQWLQWKWKWGADILCNAWPTWPTQIPPWSQLLCNHLSRKKWNVCLMIVSGLPPETCMFLIPDQWDFRGEKHWRRYQKPQHGAWNYAAFKSHNYNYREPSYDLGSEENSVVPQSHLPGTLSKKDQITYVVEEADINMINALDMTAS